MTVAAIHQPQYLPYLGFFHKLAHCDVFIVMDTAQFQRRGVQHRNRIKTANGWQWLTVPVRRAQERDAATGRSEQPTCDVVIDGEDDWQRRHWNALRLSYAHAPYFAEYADGLRDLLERPWEGLLDLDMQTMAWMMATLGIRTPFVPVSQLAATGSGSQLLANLCGAVGANTYLSGPGGRRYMDLDVFDEAGIRVIWQDFQSPLYPQVFPKAGFVPDLSALDALLSCGPDTRALIGG